MQRCHLIKVLTALSLVVLGLTACAQRGVKPATAPVAIAKPATTAPTPNTTTHAMSAAPEAASMPTPAAPGTAMPTAATAMAPAAASATQAMTAPATGSMPVATSAAIPPAASSTTAPAASTAAVPAGGISGPSLPVRGMSMANVEHIFGAPLQKLPAVPDPGTKLHPPITRWIYPNYVVYFEYNYVVHTVLKAHPFANTGTVNP